MLAKTEMQMVADSHGCTVMMIDARSSTSKDDRLQSIAHGVVQLEQLANQYGAEHQRLRVSELR